MPFIRIKFVLLTAPNTDKLGISSTESGEVGMMADICITSLWEANARDLWKFKVILGFVVCSMPARRATE